MTIWDGVHESMHREQLMELQLERLRAMVDRVYEQVPFYRHKLTEAGFEPGAVRSLDDLRGLPFTRKDDFRVNYPSGLFATPLDEVVEIHSSSGTTGRPVVAGFTRDDLHTWAELVCRLAVAAGVRRDDVAQVSFGYGMFTGGFGLHYGLQRAGAAVLPISAGNTARQLQFMQDFGTTVLIATPSYALYLGEAIAKARLDPASLKLRLGLFGAEACSDQLRAQIEARLPIFATDNYGLTEVLGPGVAGECEHRDGMHIAEDHFLVECLDPVTGEPVPDGRVGRARLHRHDAPVLAGAALPHRRPVHAQPRALCLRPHPGAHGQGGGPHRRHVHHQRRQHLPLVGGEGAARHRGRGALLPDRAGAQGRSGHVRGAGGGHGSHLRRLDGRPARFRAAHDRGAALGARARPR